MQGRTKKTIIFSILGLAVMVVLLGMYLFNKGPRSVKEENGIKISASELYQLFSKDTLAANKKFTDKILEVSGIVIKINQNQQNEAIILLGTNDAGAYINCTMEGPADRIREKDAITIKGICTGIGMGDSSMGIMGDVYLMRSYLTK